MRSDGTIYFSDPDFQAPAPLPQLKTRVYRLAPGAKQAVVVDDARQQPNGVTLSPDEKTLYLAAADGIFKYAVAPDGSTGPAQRFTNAVASGDGMVVDCAGNLYVTQTDVVVLSPAGQEIGRIPAPSANASVTNVAFGGRDRRTLFITALGAAAGAAVLMGLGVHGTRVVPMAARPGCAGGFARITRLSPPRVGGLPHGVNMTFQRNGRKAVFNARV